MKRKIIFPIILSLIVMLCAIAFAACDKKNNDDNVVYTIIYVNNYDGGVTKAEVKEGESFTPEKAPVRLGYTFDGWYLGTESDSEQFTADYKLKDSVTTVFAKWTKNENEKLVTYKYLNYVTADSTVAVSTGSKLEKPEDPKYDENETYVFENWCTDRKCTQIFDFNTSITSDITLYAGWKQDKMTITYNYNYIGSPKAVSVLYSLGGAITPPEDPVRARYLFDGWYTASAGGEKIDFATSVLSDGVTLYAHWIQNEFTVTFNLNGGTAEGVSLTADITRGQSAEEAAAAIAQAATRTGHHFGGWYTEATQPEQEISDEYLADLTSITSNLRVYAKWDLNEYNVSFDYNYTGAPAAPEAQSVKYNKIITAPVIAPRQGYIFVGWFVDEACNDQFTLEMPVTDDMTLYAKWADASLENTAVTVTFKYSLGGAENTYKTASILFAQSVASEMPANPAEDNYYFAGWYRDAQFTKVFNPNANFTENTNVYGKMLKKYTFEAEAVNFENKRGQGTSSASFEEQMIFTNESVEGGDVSNGYYVRELYSNGSYLDFEITAEEEVFDAVIFLRISSESYKFFTTANKVSSNYDYLHPDDFVLNDYNDDENTTPGEGVYSYLSPEDFRIAINGNWNVEGTRVIDGYIEYGGIFMPMANLVFKEDLAGHKTPFEDCFIAAQVHLNKGINHITLMVDNNNNHGGTFHAECPIIDCMYIYSSTNLTMKDYEYYTRPNVQH